MTLRNSTNYIGRFAPSPTGPLHFGSAVAAIASYLDARANNGQWLVRIEDLDPPRETPGAAKQIINALSALGLKSDFPIIYQSSRLASYASALNNLGKLGLVYPCGCTRREVGVNAYPGTCRGGLPSGKVPRSERFAVPEEPISFTDNYCGPQIERLRESIGDFNLVRADGLFSYHLAVVVDDHAQGITHIVRGVDLLSSTARQIALQNALGYSTPGYHHFPVVLGADGDKLSKQTGAPAIDLSLPSKIWLDALEFLKQPAIAATNHTPVHRLIELAIDNWQWQAHSR